MSQVWGYSSRPPLSKCETVLPVHSGNKPQSGASPYSISVSNSSYTTGESLTVTIQGSGSKKFKGFILQARGSDSSVAWPVGEFTEIPADGAWCWVDVNTAISRKVVGKSVRDNPERHCGRFRVLFFSKKFERIGTKGQGNVFASAKGK